MHLKILLKIIIIILVLIIVLLHLEINTSYEIITKIPSLKSSTLYVISHEYEHKDIFIIFNIFSKIKKHFYVLFADKPWNYLLEYIKPDNLTFLYVTSGTVNKLSSKLMLGHNVLLFLYNQNESSGVYHIYNNTNCNIRLIKINKNNDKLIQNNDKLIKNHYNSSYIEIYMNNLFSNYNVEFKKINKKTFKTLLEPKIFMQNIKYILNN